MWGKGEEVRRKRGGEGKEERLGIGPPGAHELEDLSVSCKLTGIS